MVNIKWKRGLFGIKILGIIVICESGGDQVHGRGARGVWFQKREIGIIAIKGKLSRNVQSKSTGVGPPFASFCSSTDQWLSYYVPLVFINLNLLHHSRFSSAWHTILFFFLLSLKIDIRYESS